MTLSLPENKIIVVEVNNYHQGKISEVKQSASRENTSSPTSTSVPVFVSGSPSPHHGDTGLPCVSGQRF